MFTQSCGKRKKHGQLKPTDKVQNLLCNRLYPKDLDLTHLEPELIHSVKVSFYNSCDEKERIS